MSRDEVHGREHQVQRQQTMARVFRTLSAVWPRHFASARGPELMPVWLFACQRVGSPVLEQAAVQFAATQGSKYPPEPATFASFAMGLERQRNGDVAPAATPTGEVFEWGDPASGRIVRMERRSDGWGVGSLSQAEYEAFAVLPEYAQLSWCQQMQQAHHLPAA